MRLKKKITYKTNKNIRRVEGYFELIDQLSHEFIFKVRIIHRVEFRKISPRVQATMVHIQILGNFLELQAQLGHFQIFLAIFCLLLANLSPPYKHIIMFRNRFLHDQNPPKFHFLRFLEGHPKWAPY